MMERGVESPMDFILAKDNQKKDPTSTSTWRSSWTFPSVTAPTDGNITPFGEKGINSPLDIPASKELFHVGSFISDPTKKSLLPNANSMTNRRKRTKSSNDNSIHSSEDEKYKKEKKHWFSNLDSQMWHMAFPRIASGYLQLLVTSLVMFLVAYIIVQFFLSVQHDMGMKVQEYQNVILAEISQCSKHYIENRCYPNERVPAMDKACLAWEACMNRDSKEVSRSKISAETIADIINGFVNPISYKTMVFFCTFVFGLLLVSNIAFIVVRGRFNDNAYQNPGFYLPNTSSMSSTRAIRRRYR